VNTTRDSDERTGKETTLELARLQQQAVQARATLTRLKLDVIEAEKLLTHKQSVELLEANQQLVLAMLRAQSDAEAASRVLEKVTRSAARDRIDAGLYRANAPSPPPSRHSSRYELALAANELRHSRLREANGQLVLSALSAQELQAAAELAQRRQTEFLAVVAHELRSPLTPIRIAATLLGEVRKDQMPRLQAIIEQQVVHMSRLVGDLLDVSRANTGKLRLERKIVDIVGIVNGAADTSRPAMDARMQRFDVDVPVQVMSVNGDAIRLAQILVNLLDNASKYTPDEGEIMLAVAVVGDEVVITVSDSGIGVTAEALPHVFDPFVQDAHAVAFNGLGLGIGLTVVRELVEGHDGTVVATSAGSGCGSQFVVTLPLVIIADAT
jgi:signal transduction histidine kinase